MIGIFDSGSGGLSVLRELRKCAPKADVTYFGDLKNAPYGNKNREELGALTVLGIEKLIEEGATEIVSACNSVSVSIVLPMFEILNLPHANIIEMVGPTVSGFRAKQGKVLVLATHATIDSGVYQEGFKMIGMSAVGVAIPELVSLIETDAGTEALAHTIRGALLPIADQTFTHVVLACTHYPLIRDVFEAVLNELRMEVILVDPAVGVVEGVVQRFDTQGEGTTRFLLSAESAVFSRFTASHCGITTPDISVL